MDLTVKAYLSKEDFSVEVRRISLKMNPQNVGGLFQSMVDKVIAVFPDLNGKKSVNVTWKDADGDFVLMSSDEELHDALSQVSADTLKIYISGCESEPVAMDEAEGTPDDPANKSSHDKELPCPPEYWPFMGPPGSMSFPHHPFGFGPPPPFGHHSGFHGRCGGPMRKRGHHGAHQHGWHGHEHGGQMHGHHHGGHFADRECDSQGMRGHHGPHKRHGGWKNVLREMVPVAQRRWAKAFIRNWRKENNKNTTTTTSDSDSEIVLTQEAAGVSEAYAQWLTTVLPKLHELWDGGSGEDSAGAFNMEEDTASVPMAFRKWVMWYLARHFGPRECPRAMRGSHFHPGRDHRHWSFGKKHGHGHFGKHHKHSEGKMHKKNWKMACRLSTLAAFIPLKHRTWARCYIQTWRLENGVPTAVAAVSTSESDDAELDTMASVTVTDVPEDYARWLQKFLPKWHLMRGQVDRQKVQMEKGGMGEFKNSVPREFRKWVKCFMAKRYGNPSGGADGRQAERGNSHYQKWMTAFQKRWLRKQDKGGHSDVIYLTSSDEDGVLGTATSDVDTDLEMENSMKRLKLNLNQSGEEKGIRGKSVQFETAINKIINGREKQFHGSMLRPVVDKEQGEYYLMRVNKGLNREFRQWAKEALYHWDGKSVNSNDVSEQDQGSSKLSQTSAAESVEKDESIPPNIYQWMSKMMEKMQKKKMAQELRDARIEMKAAKKLAHAARKSQ